MRLGEDDGADAPDERRRHRVRRRHECRELGVAKAKGASLARLGSGLVDHREIGPGDQIPIVRQRKRNDGLDLEDELRDVAGAQPEIEGGHNRDVDLIRQGVPCLLGDLLQKALNVRRHVTLEMLDVALVQPYARRRGSSCAIARDAAARRVSGASTAARRLITSVQKLYDPVGAQLAR